MNDENQEDRREETRRVDDQAAAEAAAGMVGALQDEVDGLQATLAGANARIAELEATPVEAAAPAGDDELRALATTVRTAKRNGHPDADKHLDALLAALGA